MRKKYKIIVGIAVLLIVLMVVGLALNNYVKKQVEIGLEEEFPGSTIVYDELTVNILSGSSSINSFKVKRGVVSIQAEKITMAGLSYSDFFLNKKVSIDQIELIAPQITINKSDTADSKKRKEPVEKTINLKKFKSTGGFLRIIENDTASNSLYVDLKEVVFIDISLGKEIDGDLLPFDYSIIEVETDSAYFDMNEEHQITIDNLEYIKKGLILKDFRIIPKYSKAGFDQTIPYEKDWIALTINEVLFREFLLEKPEETLVFKGAGGIVKQADLEIYRNKLLPDDNRIKPLYSEMLRELDVKINIDTVEVKNSKIVYQEKVLEDRSTAEISFFDVNATISNFSNLNLEDKDFPDTQVNAEALLMGKSQLTLNWTFNVKNKLDEFHVSGRLSGIEAEAINSFIVPAMSVEAEGEIESLAFNFYGNRNVAEGDMQLAYRNFKVNILKDGEEERKSLLSRLANLIIKNDVVNEDVEQEGIEVKRDKTKSFWNFLWLCIRDGALKTFF